NNSAEEVGAEFLRPVRPERPPGGDLCLLIRGGKDVGPPLPRAARCLGAVPGHRIVVQVVADLAGWVQHLPYWRRSSRKACSPAGEQGAPCLQLADKTP